MATLQDVLNGVAQAMEDGVPDLTTALSREGDVADNTVTFPYGEIVVVSNNRHDPWNTDFVDYATDNSGNHSGYILERKTNLELQLNIWIAVPSNSYNVQSLGTTLETYLVRFDENRPNPQTLPDGAGGTLDEVNRFRIIGGGELPVEENLDPPMRGYSIDAELRFTERIDTSEEYASEDYIETVDIPHSGDLTDGADSDEIDIEYNAT